MSETTSLPQVLQDPLGDPKGKGDCGVELGLVSLTSNGLYPRAWFWYFVVCNESQSPLSWKKEMSPQCQVHKLCQSIPSLYPEAPELQCVAVLPTSFHTVVSGAT